MARRPMTAEEKQAFKERMAAGRAVAAAKKAGTAVAKRASTAAAVAEAVSAPAKRAASRRAPSAQVMPPRAARRVAITRTLRSFWKIPAAAGIVSFVMAKIAGSRYESLLNVPLDIWLAGAAAFGPSVLPGVKLLKHPTFQMFGEGALARRAVMMGENFARGRDLLPRPATSPALQGAEAEGPPTREEARSMMNLYADKV